MRFEQVLQVLRQPWYTYPWLLLYLARLFTEGFHHTWIKPKAFQRLDLGKSYVYDVIESCLPPVLGYVIDQTKPLVRLPKHRLDQRY
jgi:hypothetical protein